MGAPVWPLTADRDAGYTLRVRIRDDNGDPLDLSEHTCALILLARSTATDVLHTHAATSDEDGWIEVEVNANATADWPNGRLAYRLIAEHGGNAEFLLVGPFTVRTPADA